MARTLRLVTWNVNSVRSRLPHLERLIAIEKPDILCLQETKVADELFPRQWFVDRGYDHLSIAGQRGYHGVAIASRVPLVDDPRLDWGGKPDARHQAVRIGATPVVLHNVYVPAGGDIPDPLLNDKFAHKLGFLDDMTKWSKKLDRKAAMILVGDLNVAPYEHDVWSHKALLKIVSHTPIETDRMIKLIAAGQWIDVMRRFVPDNEKLYSWWSYRARDWQAADKGRRLDHVWLTQPLDTAPKSMRVLKDARAWDKPSDHVPVIVDLAL